MPGCHIAHGLQEGVQSRSLKKKQVFIYKKLTLIMEIFHLLIKEQKTVYIADLGILEGWSPAVCEVISLTIIGSWKQHFLCELSQTNEHCSAVRYWLSSKTELSQVMYGTYTRLAVQRWKFSSLTSLLSP